MIRHLHSPIYRLVELIILMIGIPAALSTIIPLSYMLPALWIAALYCHLIYRALVDAPNRIYWRWHELNRANLKPILLRFAAAAVLMTAIVLALVPEQFLSFVRERPGFWAIVMVAYPILSVIPQEIIFRNFFFTRYASMFGSERMLVLASGVTFGLAHLIFNNWVAPTLCVIGGIMFAQTYAKTRSLALVVVEHALYGCFLFTLGIGRYFYHGAAGPQ